MRRTATGQRPQLNQAHSSGWRWPRLLPIQEQHARASQDSQSPPRTSGTQSLHGEGEQVSSPTEQGKIPATSNIQPEAEVGKTALAPTSEGHSSETDNSMPSTSMGKNHPTSPTIAQGPMSGPIGNPSYASGSSVKSPERKYSDAMRGDMSPKDEPAVASSEDRHTNNDPNDSSASGGPDVGSTARRPTQRANDDISQNAESSAPRDPDVGSKDRKPSHQANDDVSSKEDSSATGSPDVGSTDRRPTHQANDDIFQKAESSASRDPDVGGTDRSPSHQAIDDVSKTEDSAAGSEGRMYSSGAKGSASTVSGLNKQPSANGEEPDRSDALTDESLSGVSNETDQGPGPRREIASSKKEAKVGSPMEDEEPKAMDRSSQSSPQGLHSCTTC